VDTKLTSNCGGVGQRQNE